MNNPSIPQSKTPEAPAALEQLFRHSLRYGRVHPLLHLVRRYREESPR